MGWRALLPDALSRAASTARTNEAPPQQPAVSLSAEAVYGTATSSFEDRLESYCVEISENRSAIFATLEKLDGTEVMS